MNVVRFGVEQVESLASLLDAYMAETFRSGWMGSIDRLVSDHARGRLGLAVASSTGGSGVGFVAWTPSYDLHHAVHGAEILDLFVAPHARGRGAALKLLAFAAKEVREQGGLFIKGSVAGDARNRRFYARAAVVESGTACTLSGRAFQALADTWLLDPRAAVRALPPVSANDHG